MLKFMTAARAAASGLLAAAMVLFLAEAAAAQTLRMWGPEQLNDPEIAKLWNEIKADFEKRNPGVTVQYMQPTGTISNGAVQAAIQSDAGPDVLLTNSGIGRVGVVANAKLVQPLGAAYEKRGWKDRLHPWLYAELKRQFDGEIYEFPDGLDVIGLWYHKDVMTQKGWQVPQTYAQLLALFDEARKAGLQPLVVGPRNNASGGHLFGNLMQVTAGRDKVGEVVAGKRPWTDPAIVASAQRVIDLVERGALAKDMVALDLDAAARLFFTKRAAFMFAGPWFTSNARRAGYDLDKAGFMPLPVDPGQGESLPTGGVGWSWMVSAKSKQTDLALRWIDYIVSQEVMVKRATHASNWMVFPQALPGLQPSTPILKTIFDSANKGVGYNPSVYIPGNVVEAYLQAITGLVGGQVNAKDAMAGIQVQAERAARP
ncbi:MAG: extracellular solute-binding protein [Rhodospirillales bacterium]|nr:extracellular solute-binding protein [Rhodospirillales bacterium]